MFAFAGSVLMSVTRIGANPTYMNGIWEAGQLLKEQLEAAKSLSDRKKVIVHNAAAASCAKAQDAWKVMKYNAERHLHRIDTIMKPKIEALVHYQVPAVIMDEIYRKSRQVQENTQLEIDLATREIDRCHTTLSSLVSSHIANADCYKASQKYIEKTFQEQKRCLVMKSLTNWIMTRNEPVDEEANLATLRRHYKRSLQQLLDAISQETQKNEILCIASDPVIRNTAQYFIQKLGNMCEEFRPRPMGQMPSGSRSRVVEIANE